VARIDQCPTAIPNCDTNALYVAVPCPTVTGAGPEAFLDVEQHALDGLTHALGGGQVAKILQEEPRDHTQSEKVPTLPRAVRVDHLTNIIHSGPVEEPRDM